MDPEITTDQTSTDAAEDASINGAVAELGIEDVDDDDVIVEEIDADVMDVDKHLGDESLSAFTGTASLEDADDLVNAVDQLLVDETTPKKTAEALEKDSDVYFSNMFTVNLGAIQKLLMIFHRNGTGIQQKRTREILSTLRNEGDVLNLSEFLERITKEEPNFKLKACHARLAELFMQPKGYWVKTENVHQNMNKQRAWDMFSNHGKVVDIFLIGDAHPMSEIVVVMETKEGQEKAISALNDKPVKGFGNNKLMLSPYDLKVAVNWDKLRGIPLEQLNLSLKVKEQLKGLLEFRGKRKIYNDLIKIPSISSGEASLRVMIEEAMKMIGWVKMSKSGLQHPDWKDDEEFVSQLTKRNAAHELLWKLLEYWHGDIQPFCEVFLPVLIEKMESGADVSEKVLHKCIFQNYPEVWIRKTNVAEHDLPDIDMSWVLVHNIPKDLTESQFADFLKDFGQLTKVIFVQKEGPKVTAVFKADSMKTCTKAASYIRTTPLPGATEPSKLMRYTGKFAKTDHPFNKMSLENKKPAGSAKKGKNWNKKQNKKGDQNKQQQDKAGQGPKTPGSKNQGPRKPNSATPQGAGNRKGNQGRGPGQQQTPQSAGKRFNQGNQGRGRQQQTTQSAGGNRGRQQQTPQSAGGNRGGQRKRKSTNPGMNFTSPNKRPTPPWRMDDRSPPPRMTYDDMMYEQEHQFYLGGPQRNDRQQMGMGGSNFGSGGYSGGFGSGEGFGSGGYNFNQGPVNFGGGGAARRFDNQLDFSGNNRGGNDYGRGNQSGRNDNRQRQDNYGGGKRGQEMKKDDQMKNVLLAVSSMMAQNLKGKQFSQQRQQPEQPQQSEFQNLSKQFQQLQEQQHQLQSMMQQQMQTSQSFMGTGNRNAPTNTSHYTGGY